VIRSALKKGLKAARTVKEGVEAFLEGPQGPGHGVAEFEDFDRLRAEAHALDVAEGNDADAGDDMDDIADGTVEMSCEDLRVMLEIEEDDDLPVLVDVREQHEWDAGHLEDAIHIPLGRLDEEAIEVDRNRLVVVYCAGGMRSIDGSYVLKRQGFPRVKSLAGGYNAWERAGNQVAKPS